MLIAFSGKQMSEGSRFMKFIEDNACNRSRIENVSIIVKVQCKSLKGGE